MEKGKKLRCLNNDVCDGRKESGNLMQIVFFFFCILFTNLKSILSD